MKKSILIFFLFITTATFMSCTWQLPQSVSIKTAATYNFSVGEVRKDFGEYFSTDAIMSANFSDNPMTRLYDYFPGKIGSQCQKYLMKIPVQDIAVDFTQYFNETQLAENITDLSFDKHVTVPSIGLTVDQNIDVFGLAVLLNTVVNGSGTSDITFQAGFTSIKYTSGQMIVTCDNSVSGTLTLKNGTRVITTGTINGTTGYLDLAGKTIEKNGMKLEGPAGAGTYHIAVSPSSVVNEARGITKTGVGPLNVSVPISTGSASTYNECTVGTGSMNIALVLPTGWTNTAVQYGVTITGALNASAPPVPGLSKSVSLNGKTIYPGTATIASAVTFNFTNANLNFGSQAKMTGSANISSYSSISMTLSGVNTSLNQVENISTEMKQTVTELVLNKSGLKGKYINTFPAGNDIGITASSDFIGLSSKSATLSSNVSSETNFGLHSDNAEKHVEFSDTHDPSSNKYSRMDFAVNVSLPGATASNPDRIKVVNVVPGTEYQIKIQMEPDVKWKQISLKAEGTQQTAARSTGVNVSQMFQAFSQAMGAGFDGKVTLKKLPVYIYSVRPDMDCFQQAKFEGDLKIYYGVPDSTAPNGIRPKIAEYGEEVFLDRNDPAKQTMPFVDQPVLVRENDIIVTDINRFTPSQKGDLSTICNNAKDDTTGTLIVDYDLKFKNSAYASTDTFTITYDEYVASGSTSSSIAIFAYIEIPLNYLLSDDVPMDLFSMIGGGSTDLLGRSGPTSDEDKNSFLSAIRCAKISYSATQLPFYGIPTANIVFDLDGASNNLFEVQTLSMSGGTLNIYDYSEMVEVYPLMPSVQVVLRQGEFTIPRNVILASKINLSLEMDSKCPITVFGGKK